MIIQTTAPPRGADPPLLSWHIVTHCPPRACAVHFCLLQVLHLQVLPFLHFIIRLLRLQLRLRLRLALPLGRLSSPGLRPWQTDSRRPGPALIGREHAAPTDLSRDRLTDRPTARPTALASLALVCAMASVALAGPAELGQTSQAANESPHAVTNLHEISATSPMKSLGRHFSIVRSATFPAILAWRDDSVTAVKTLAKIVKHLKHLKHLKGARA